MLFSRLVARAMLTCDFHGIGTEKGKAMSFDYFASASTLAALLSPSAVTADGNSPGLDIRDYVGDLALVLSAKNTAGTSPTMAVKLQAAADANVISNVVKTGTGNGTIMELEGGPDSVAETITITFSSATAFSVSGSVTGAMGSGTVGTLFTSAQASFRVLAGSTAFVNTDTIAFTTAARTYADIGVAFTGLTTGSSVQRITATSDKLGRFLRANLDIGGTASPAYTMSIALLGMKQ